MSAVLVQRRRALSADCPRPASEVVVTVNGYIIDCCAVCARAMCDPAAGVTATPKAKD